jgi:hypothetical protein
MLAAGDSLANVPLKGLQVFGPLEPSINPPHPDQATPLPLPPSAVHLLLCEAQSMSAACDPPLSPSPYLSFCPSPSPINQTSPPLHQAGDGEGMEDLSAKKAPGPGSVGAGTPGSMARVLSPAGAGAGAGVSVFGSPEAATGKTGVRAVSTFDLVDRGT